MEKFDRREAVLLGCDRLRRPPSSEAAGDAGDSEFDFGDVFGGPPRRFSTQEARKSHAEAADPNENQGQKPVFGGDCGNRKRCPNGDFFEDIFGGSNCESYGSPRWSERMSVASNPGSRVLSPARPLPPKAEPFGASVPSIFSLPAKLTKAVDFPVFDSGNYGPYRKQEVITNGVNHQFAKSSSLSRFSSEVMGQDEMKQDIESYDQNPIPLKIPLNTEQSINVSVCNETDMGDNLKNKDSESVALPSNGGQFHFSIYKWAGKGLPLLTTFRAGSTSKLKEKHKTERCSSSNGRMQSGNALSKPLQVNQSEKVDGVESFLGEDKSVLNVTESVTSDGIRFTVENIPESGFTSNKGEETKLYSLFQDERKTDIKPMRSFLSDEIEGQGYDETREAEHTEKTFIKSEMSRSEVDLNKKATAKESSSVITRSPHRHLGDYVRKSRVKGKVKEFVQLFNQEAPFNSKVKVAAENQFSGQRSSSPYTSDNGPNSYTVQTSQKKHMSNMNKIHDSSALVGGSREKLIDMKQNYVNRTSFYKAHNCSNDQNHESFPNISEVDLGDIDESFQDNILIEELFYDQDNDMHAGEGFEEFQDMDVKIGQWSKQKKGNIRSLLSTLHLILWSGSGWKPVALVDIVEGTAVKRTYQKALLCLHPDKLQQKGATSNQRYIAEKVFDLLQDAWDQFNSLSSL